jgi:hypothetical protein
MKVESGNSLWGTDVDVMARSSSQLPANAYTINASVCLPICLCTSVYAYGFLCLLMFAYVCRLLMHICLCLWFLMFAYVCLCMLTVCLWVITSVKECSIGTTKQGRKGSV